MNDCLAICHLLKAASSCCERLLNESLSELGVSHCQGMILLKLTDESVSMSALSKEMCCHKSNITQVVSGLEKKGYIARAETSGDKRVRHLKLTAKGKDACEKLNVILTKRACSCMGIFSPVQRKAFAALLKKYVDHHRG